jgi:intein/homing endonuclease
MDNPQVTAFELGWLSGIIDGEGCFSMSPGSKGSYNVGIKLVNTNKIIIEKICEILRKLGLAFHIYDSTRSSNQRPAKRVEINGVMRVEKALKILLPYIVAKHEEATVLFEYVTKRLATPYGKMNPNEDLAVYHWLRQLKR